MDPTYCKISQIMPAVAFFLVLMISSVFPVHSHDFNQANRTLSPSEKSDIAALLEKINKPYVKTIQSPDGDVIDCVPTHLQPAFDHPLLKGKKPLDPPERPKGVNPNETVAEIFQLWSSSGESCPEGTIPIRRTTEQDVLRASSIERFGRKMPSARASSSNEPEREYAISFMEGEYYGAEAIINVWQPLVAESNEFSLAQIWLTAGSSDDLNAVEAGWQVYPLLYEDSTNPRFFIYWTRDGYETTGCYNLVCPGFIQINNSIALGAAISPVSSYGGTQYGIDILIWKGCCGEWWLAYGSFVIGYWPSELFTNLNYADTVDFGGEIVNTEPDGIHTSTEMGSGHYAGEGFGNAATFGKIEVQGPDKSWNRFPNLELYVSNPQCYDVVPGNIDDPNWGTYFYFGGPGRNAICT